MDAITIKTVEQFIAQVRADSAGWLFKWFRGEPAGDTPLIPKLYRPRPDGRTRDENTLLQLFRMRAPTFSARPCPDRGATDQWLFLAQHFGLPTRLLDWTESALVGLYFAIQESNPPKPKPHVVWMLNPTELNQRSVSPGYVSSTQRTSRSPGSILVRKKPTSALSTFAERGRMTRRVFRCRWPFDLPTLIHE